MTDQEHKLEIIIKNFKRICEEVDNEKPNETSLREIKTNKDIQTFLMRCMDEWAGVISARIDEQDADEDEDIRI